ncbi:hypothetical protein AYI68_g424 [Smittium mucronatum]|uniref:Uncharacterized protein n=1 Tax=Smittium mucronatum TaxID=133383 RepID=A0A1R0H8E9_9FUNG|nr:hypothetical protein AYI68_g424 [Smittium mucronatum]
MNKRPNTQNDARSLLRKTKQLRREKINVIKTTPEVFKTPKKSSTDISTGSFSTKIVNPNPSFSVINHQDSKAKNQTLIQKKQIDKTEEFVVDGLPKGFFDSDLESFHVPNTSTVKIINSNEPNSKSKTIKSPINENPRTMERSPIQTKTILAFDSKNFKGENVDLNIENQISLLKNEISHLSSKDLSIPNNKIKILPEDELTKEEKIIYEEIRVGEDVDSYYEKKLQNLKSMKDAISQYSSLIKPKDSSNNPIMDSITIAPITSEEIPADYNMAIESGKEENASVITSSTLSPKSQFNVDSDSEDLDYIVDWRSF